MTLSKIVDSGTITKNPEKRFTQNNLPITSFVMDINPQDETLVRVLALGNLAEKVAAELSVGDGVVVDGRPQIEVVKTASGKDKRVIEVSASAVEKLNGSQSAAPAAPASSAATDSAKSSGDIVRFATEDLSEEPLSEDEIPF